MTRAQQKGRDVQVCRLARAQGRKLGQNLREAEAKGGTNRETEWREKLAHITRGLNAKLRHFEGIGSPMPGLQ